MLFRSTLHTSEAAAQQASVEATTKEEASERAAKAMNATKAKGGKTIGKAFAERYLKASRAAEAEARRRKEEEARRATGDGFAGFGSDETNDSDSD